MQANERSEFAKLIVSLYFRLMQPEQKNKPKLWKWGFYNNPDDPRVFVKTTDYGYRTMYGLNYAHKESYIITIVLVIAGLLLAYGKFFGPTANHH